ncbi:MAG TPA: hypothetical protein VL989_04005 [Candidatus Sulfotelmatobacter sp.]|nr:hypothetical protein [Candidatus Sulfotelmatobacter sp.]
MNPAKSYIRSKDFELEPGDFSGAVQAFEEAVNRQSVATVRNSAGEGYPWAGRFKKGLGAIAVTAALVVGANAFNNESAVLAHQAAAESAQLQHVEKVNHAHEHK